MRFEPVPGLSDSGPSTSSSSPAGRARRRRQTLQRAAEASVQMLESRMMLSASLLKDINPTLADANPYGFTLSGNSLFFEANDGIHGYQLWKTNGTAAGTTELTNLVPGGTYAFDTTDVGGTLYFFNGGPYPTKEAEPGADLWRTDGTAAGSVDLGVFDGPGNLTNVNGTAYFTAYTDPSGEVAELFKSDGTSAGTVLVKSFGHGSGPTLLTSFNGSLYFASGSQIWKTDGTAAGTVEVVDTGTVISSMKAIDGRLFLKQTTSQGTTLLTSDGTAAAPAVLGTFAELGALGAYNGAVYFGATDANHVSGLWTIDGTAADTVLVKAIPVYSQFLQPGPFAVVNGMLYFEVTSSSTKTDLWRSDGTTQGTVVDNALLGSASLPQFGSELALFNGNVYFRATDGEHGVQLWRSNGTPAGTYQVDQLNPTGSGSGIAGDASVTYEGETYFFTTSGLWKTDGTAAGTTQVSDVTGFNLTDVNGTLYFAGSGTTAPGLWKSDGTAAGTVRVADVSPFRYTPNGSVLYFFGPSTNAIGVETLYRTDGTTAGTAAVMDVSPTSSTDSVPSMASVDGTLFFTTHDTSSGVNLYKIGPGGVTPALIEQFFNSENALPTDLTAVNGNLYFAANGALYETDGATTPTMVWQSLYMAPGALFAFNGAIYATLDEKNGVPLSGLFRFDVGSRQMQQIYSGPTPVDFVIAGGKLYFESYDGAANYRNSLFVTDGTSAGTHDVDKGLGVASNYDMTEAVGADGRLYFIASDGTHGDQLWQTDGTTTTLADPSEAANGWTPNTLLGQANGGLVFGATDAAHGSEPWVLPFPSSATAALVKTDSTTQGTYTGIYGNDGFSILGFENSLPSYATVDYQNAQFWQWSTTSSSDPRAPQDSPTNPNRFAGCYFSGTSFTVDLNLTDGQAHQVAFYLLDCDRLGRSEMVQVADGDSGRILGTQSVSKFDGGKYLVYTLSGHVKITFANGAGSRNAVLSAILFDPAPARVPATAQFDGVDAGTGGQWTGVYGSQGYQVIGGTDALPGFASVTTTDAQSYLWSTASGDSRNLQTAAGSSDRVAACYYADAPSFSLDVNLTDGKPHRVALYLLDYDARSRAERITITDANTGAVLDTQTASSFYTGQYVYWDLSGHVKITITNAGGLNEVVTGIFIDSAARAVGTSAAYYVGTDATTQGDWSGTYGSDGYSVFNAGSSLPGYAAVTLPSTVQNYTWGTNAGDRRELQTGPGATSRIAACDFSDAPSFTFDVNLADSRLHRVALYFLDYDARGRAETVTISDANTGTLLDRQSVSDFTQGKYLVWNLSGHLKITISNAGGLNEVLSGIFFG